MDSRLLVSVVSGLELRRWNVADGRVKRVVFRQWTQASVANSTSSTVRHGPRLKMSSPL